MKRKLWYAIPLMLVLLALMGPLIHANNPDRNNTPDLTGEVANSSPNQDSGEIQNKATTTSKISGLKQEGPQEPVAPTDPTPSSEKGSLLSQTESYSSEKMAINIAVVGRNGELLFGPGMVKIPKDNAKGATALGVLAATGLQYQTSKRFPDFVEDIAGLSNKGQAGWLYKINDEVPMVAAGKKPVAVNDYVIWWYSSSINDPSPSWEQLFR